MVILILRGKKKNTYVTVLHFFCGANFSKHFRNCDECVDGFDHLVEVIKPANYRFGYLKICRNKLSCLYISYMFCGVYIFVCFCIECVWANIYQILEVPKMVKWSVSQIYIKNCLSVLILKFMCCGEMFGWR